MPDGKWQAGRSCDKDTSKMSNKKMCLSCGTTPVPDLTEDRFKEFDLLVRSQEV
jgi:hypothetical protein